MPAPQAPAPTGNARAEEGRAREAPAARARPPEGIQRVEREQGDRINVWPHLLIEEFVALLVVLAGLTIFSTLVNAPCASSRTRTSRRTRRRRPGTSSASRSCSATSTRWSGVVFAPTLVLLALAVVPFVDRNPSIKPGTASSRSRCSRC